MPSVLETVRRFAKPGVALGPEVRLGEIGASASLGLSLLRVALVRHYGPRVPTLTAGMTLRALELALEGSTTASAEKDAAENLGQPRSERSDSTPRTRAGGGLWGARPRAAGAAVQPVWFGHGVDLEEIADFPSWPPVDVEKRTFFENHFTTAELAGAEKHPEPRAHLCGLWCAKEAVRKAVPAVAQADWRAIEIVADANGAPGVRCHVMGELQLALSISHSSRQAMASVIVWTGAGA
jgi:holo-[acyl-carrier protein] synthase